MIDAFFPTVRLLAKQSVWASIRILVNGRLLIPALTLRVLILVLLVPPSVVLPVVSENANVTLVARLIIRTPNRLEVEDIKVFVAFELVD